MSKFKEIFLHKQDLLRNRPDKCRVETKAESHLVEDFRSHVKTRGFDVVLDQPENMGSSDLGPRPGELLLAALAACHEATYRLYADTMDIDLQDVAVSVTGVSDARGFSMWMTRLTRDSQKFSARSILSAMPATKGFSGRTFLG